MRGENEQLAIIIDLDDPGVRRQLAELLKSDAGPARLMIETEGAFSYLAIAPLRATLKCKPLAYGSWTPSLGYVHVRLERVVTPDDDPEPTDTLPDGNERLNGGGWVSGPSIGRPALRPVEDEN